MAFLIPGELIFLAAKAIVCYNSSVLNRDRPPQKHRAGLPLRLGHQIETVVHPIDEIDVRGARRGEEVLGTGRALIAVGVTGLVHPAHIGLGLHDAAHQSFSLKLPHQELAQQIPSHLHGVPVIKGLWQDLHLAHPRK